MLALAGGVTAVVVLGSAASAWIGARWPSLGGVSAAVARGALFLVPFVVLQAMGALLRRLGKVIFLGGLDRVAGAILGAGTAAVVAGAVVAAASSWPGAAKWLEGSKLAAPLAEGFRVAADWAGRTMTWR